MNNSECPSFKRSSAPSAPMKMNRRTAIRLRCLDCSAGSRAEVERCHYTDCPLHPFRMGTGKQNAKARHKAIKAYCLWCCCGQRTEVVLCPVKGCPLYPYRKSSVDHPTRTAMFCNKMPYRGSFKTSDDLTIHEEAPA